MRKQIAMRKIDMAKVGHRMRTLISIHDDSISHFADKIGISRNSLYKIVHGQVTPDAQTLVDICDRLGCSVDFLLGMESPLLDSYEAYETALMNIFEFRDEWSRNQRLFLVYTSMGCLSEQEEKQLRAFLNLNPGHKSPKNPGSTSC